MLYLLTKNHSFLTVTTLLSLFSLATAQASTTPQSTRGAYTSIQVNIDAQGENIAGDAANEPSIAMSPVNPNNMVIVWRHFENPTVIDSPKAGVAYSHDGGINWTFPGVLSPAERRTDPVVDVDSQGNFYYQSLRTFPSRQVDVFKSTDSGVTWQAPVFAHGIDGDKNWLAIDRSDTASDGHIYGYWRESPTPEHFSRSVDQGASFEAPVLVDIPNDPVYGTMTVGPQGNVYIAGRNEVSGQIKPNAFPKLYFDPYRFAISTDAKDPASTPTFSIQALDMGGSAVTYLHRNKPNRAGQQAQINVVVDSSNTLQHGNIYVLSSVEPENSSDPEDIHIIRSADGGTSWSAPVRVNDDPPGTNAWQWFSTLAVAPNSRLDVVWYDTRNTTSYEESELYYAYSWDAGATWSHNVPVSQAFNTHVGNPLSSDKIGDYIGAISDTAGMHVAYPATFNDEQDIYYVYLFPDCNNNTVPDSEDIANSTSLDTDASNIPDECEIVIVPGDLDTDGDVDRNDMNILLAARNQAATPPQDPRDLDGDGIITVLDARKLRLLCTRPRCANN